MWISAGPAGSGFGTVSVAVCCALVERDRWPSASPAPAPMVTSRNVDLDGVAARRVRVGSVDLHADRFGAVEPLAREIDDEGEVVVARA